MKEKSQEDIKSFMQLKNSPTVALWKMFNDLTASIKAEMGAELQKMREQHSLEIKQIHEEKAAQIQESLKNSLPNLDDILESITGNDGEDADPEEVANLLFDMPEFIAMTKAKDGQSVKLSEVINALKQDQTFVESLKGKNGSSVKLSEVIQAILSNSAFIEKVKAKDISVESIVHSLVAEIKTDVQFIESLKGKKGEDGSPDKGAALIKKINGLPIRSEFQIDASHIKNIKALVRKGKLHGSGVTGLTAGSNITLTPDGHGGFTVSALGGGSSLETPSGTIDGSNTVFTVSHTPSYIVVDGLSKFVTTNYTYLAGIITITDGAPPVLSIMSFY